MIQIIEIVVAGVIGFAYGKIVASISRLISTVGDYNFSREEILETINNAQYSEKSAPNIRECVEKKLCNCIELSVLYSMLNGGTVIVIPYIRFGPKPSVGLHSVVVRRFFTIIDPTAKFTTNIINYFLAGLFLTKTIFFPVPFGVVKFNGLETESLIQFQNRCFHQEDGFNVTIPHQDWD